MVLSGYARRLSGDLDPAQIIEPTVAASGDPALLAAECLATVEPDFSLRVREGDVLLLTGTLTADSNPDAAIFALQSVGIAAVVCTAVAPDFQALAARYGLPILSVPAATTTLSDAALVRLDLERGTLESAGVCWSFAPLDAIAITATRRAQLLVRMRRVVEEEGLAE